MKMIGDALGELTPGVRPQQAIDMVIKMFQKNSGSKLEL